MDLKIKGRSAIVCASSEGLGFASANALAQAGCKVIMNGRRADVLNAAAARIRSETGATVQTVVADVSTAKRPAPFVAGYGAGFAGSVEPVGQRTGGAGRPCAGLAGCGRRSELHGGCAACWPPHRRHGGALGRGFQ